MHGHGTKPPLGQPTENPGQRLDSSRMPQMQAHDAARLHPGQRAGLHGRRPRVAIVVRVDVESQADPIPAAPAAESTAGVARSICEGRKYVPSDPVRRCKTSRARLTSASRAAGDRADSAGWV